MSILYRYPFKAMIPIVKSLASTDESLNIYDIQRVSRACVPDTTEVTEMLSFLTSYGKVFETSKGWIRTNENGKKPNRPRRFFYLKDIYNILSELSEENPLNCGIIAENTNINVEKVLEYLDFLSAITKAGYVKLDNNNYPSSYIMNRLD
ncbi:MAG: hypothetical protein ACW981_08950 [Candidatus Hodarchaeales archaeon]